MSGTAKPRAPVTVKPSGRPPGSQAPVVLSGPSEPWNVILRKLLVRVEALEAEVKRLEADKMNRAHPILG